MAVNRVRAATDSENGYGSEMGFKSQFIAKFVRSAA